MKPIIVTKGAKHEWYVREQKPFTLVDVFLTLAGWCVILHLLNLLVTAVAAVFYF